MVYMMVASVLQFITLAYALQFLRQVHSPDRSSFLTSAYMVFGMTISALLAAAPFVLELLARLRLSNGGAIAINGDYRAIWLLGAGAITTLITFGLLLRQRIRAHADFSALGVPIIGLAAGAYLTLVTIDQLQFYAPPRQDAGMLNWSIMRNDPALADIHCEQPIMVVKGTSTDQATYRCPRSEIVVMDSFTGTPVIPWPSYEEGTSEALSRRIAEISRDAKAASQIPGAK